jgi:Protein of unknown function (DUF2752)
VVPWTSWRHRAIGLGVVAVIGAGLAYLYTFDPNEPGHYPACPTKALFGVDCPGCGAARCLHALLHGDLGRAVDHNVFLVAVLPLLVGFTAYWAWGRFVHPVRHDRLPMAVAWGFAALALGFAVARNLPWEPLTYLAAAAS